MALNCKLIKAVDEQALKNTLGSIKKAVAAGDKVTLIGFGTFLVSDRAARIGRNPQNGEPIKIPASKAVIKAVKKLVMAIR